MCETNLIFQWDKKCTGNYITDHFATGTCDGDGVTGKTCTLECETGYIQSGDLTIICDMDGNYSIPEGTCTSKIVLIHFFSFKLNNHFEFLSILSI